MNDNNSSVSSDFKSGKNLTLGLFCIIEEDVIVGDNVTIQNFSMIQKGSRIGNNTFIGTYSKIGENVVIGENTRMTAYCEIRSNCKVGSNVSFGSRCTLSSYTIVEDNVIVKYGFVATDTPVLGKGEKKICVLKKDSKYGANVVIMPGITIGENAEIGACSQVRHDVGDNQVWYGSPAKYFKNSKP